MSAMVKGIEELTFRGELIQAWPLLDQLSVKVQASMTEIEASSFNSYTERRD